MKTRTIKLGRQYRLATIEAREGEGESDDRTADLSFSSEDPYERYWGIEILGHKRGEVQMDWMKSGNAPLLLQHRSDQQIGVIESASIDGGEKKGRARVRFSRSAMASEVLADVRDGIRRNVSVGYQIDEIKLVSEADGKATYRVTNWTPFEASIVSIPADTTVGVGRAETEGELHEVRVIEEEKREMPDPVARDTPAPVNAIDQDAIRREAADAAVKSENARASLILDLGERYKMPQADIQDAIRKQKSPEDFRQAVIAHQEKKLTESGTPVTDLDMPDQERKKYSILRAIRAHAEKDWSRAGLEREASQEIERRLDREPNGFFVPYDIMRSGIDVKRAAAMRDLNTNLDTAGGHLVAEEHMAGDFIQLLRNRMSVTRLGARMLSGLVGNLDIPKLTGAATLEWLAEGGGVTGSDQTFGNVTMSPKTAAAKTKLTRRILMQSSPDVENMVRDDLNQIVALGIDSAAINADGSGNQPTGIRFQTGVGSITNGTNGGALDWAKVVEFETGVSVANADVGTLAYLTNAKVRGRLKTTEKAANTAQFIWMDGSEAAAGNLNGYQAVASQQVPSTNTKGTSNGILSSMIFGNFSDLFIGNWGVLDLQADPYSAGDEGALILRIFQDLDLALRHPESFSVADDIVT